MRNGIKINEIDVKGIVTKSGLPDADYVVNPYIGCQHGCIYCYAEFMKRFTGHHEKWGEFVDVKINSPELIHNPGKYRNKKILFSSVTDPYQQLEAKHKLTRNILEALVDGQPKIEILTKSKLVVRDIEVLKRFDDATVGISISTLNEKYSRDIEPYASSPKMRLDALRQCEENGLRTYVFLSPMFPYITEIEEIIELSKSFSDYYMFENLNVRANNKSRVFSFIEQNEPTLLPKYAEIYEQKNQTYWDALEEQIKGVCRKNKKEARIYFHHKGSK